jgi:CRP-like cAMP-binding protein
VNDTGNFPAFIIRPEVRGYSTKGAALLIDIVLPNQLFGAVFHPHDPVYPCTAVAIKPTELLSFRRKDLMEDLENNPPLQRMLLADTCYKLCQVWATRGHGKCGAFEAWGLEPGHSFGL